MKACVFHDTRCQTLHPSAFSSSSVAPMSAMRWIISCVRWTNATRIAPMNLFKLFHQLEPTVVFMLHAISRAHASQNLDRKGRNKGKKPIFERKASRIETMRE